MLKHLPLLLILSSGIHAGNDIARGMPIINAILDQKDDRYEVVREILDKDPKQVDLFVARYGFTVYQEGKIIDKSHGPYFPLNAAIDMDDLRMVELLAERGADLCQATHQASYVNYCAIRYAAEKGKKAIHEYLKRAYASVIRDTEGRKVFYWSEMPTEDKEQTCRLWAADKNEIYPNGMGYQVCMGMAERVFYGSRLK